MINCKICNEQFKDQKALIAHLRKHKISNLEYHITYENFVIPKCKICGKDAKQHKGLNFRVTCGSKECRSKLSKSFEHSDEIKDRISQSMKIAHKDGRANNWQDSKKVHIGSYPEQFFESIIINHFNDQNYVKEYRVGPYAIDFAWISKKIAIEIDGKQHEYEEHKNRDIQKDKLLKDYGWTVIRIKWKDLFNNTKEYINYTKSIVDNFDIDYEEIYNLYNVSINYYELKKSLKKIDNAKKDQIIDSILNSNIDFSKIGWVHETAKIIGISDQKVTNWMRRNMYDFWLEKCFKRKGTIIEG